MKMQNQGIRHALFALLIGAGFLLPAVQAEHRTLKFVEPVVVDNRFSGNGQLMINIEGVAIDCQEQSEAPANVDAIFCRESTTVVNKRFVDFHYTTTATPSTSAIKTIELCTQKALLFNSNPLKYDFLIMGNFRPDHVPSWQYSYDRNFGVRNHSRYFTGPAEGASYDLRCTLLPKNWKDMPVPGNIIQH